MTEFLGQRHLDEATSKYYQKIVRRDSSTLGVLKSKKLYRQRKPENQAREIYTINGKKNREATEGILRHILNFMFFF